MKARVSGRKPGAVRSWRDPLRSTVGSGDGHPQHALGREQVADEPTT